MYALLKDVIDSLPPSVPKRDATTTITGRSSPTEGNTVDHPPQDHEQHDSAETGGSDDLPVAEDVDRAPRPTRLRVVLALSLLSWVMLALAVAWVVLRL